MDLDLSVLGYRFVESCFRNYQGTCMFIAFFLAVIVYWFAGKDKRAKYFFIPYIIILFATVFNPFVMKPVLTRLKLTDEYYRFIWLLPVVLGLAYVGTKAVIMQKKLWKQAAVFILLAGVLTVTGTTLKVKAFPIADNIYKIPQDLIKVVDIMHRDAETAEWDSSEIAVLYDFDLNLLATQYDPSLPSALPYEMMMAVRNEGREPLDSDPVEVRMRLRMLQVLMKGFQMNHEDFMEALNITGVKYAVYPIESPLHTYLTGAGFYEIGRSDNYVVYRYHWAS